MKRTPLRFLILDEHAVANFGSSFYHGAGREAGLFEARTEAGKTAAGLDVGVHG
jgi:hypothetical protein